MYQKKVKLSVLVAQGALDIDTIIAHPHRVTGLVCKSNSYPPRYWYFMVDTNQENISPFSVSVKTQTGKILFENAENDDDGIMVEEDDLITWLSRPDADELIVEYTFPNLPPEEVVE